MRIPISKAFPRQVEQLERKLEIAGYKDELGDDIKQLAQTIVKVEITIFVLKELFPKEQEIRSIPNLFYTSQLPSYFSLDLSQQTMIANLHALLSSWRIKRVVQTHIRDFRNLRNVQLHVQFNGENFSWRSLTQGDREDAYREILCNPLPLRYANPVYPKEETVEMFIKPLQKSARVKMPDYFQKDSRSLPLDHIDEEREPIRVTIEDLLKTAKRMDKKWNKNWFKRMKEVVFLDPLASLNETEELVISGTQHFAGPLSVGKTTTMQVMATLLAERKMVTTLVVKDIAEVLTFIDTFAALGVRAVPVVSWRNRDNHIRQYLQTFSDKQRFSMDILRNPAFRYLGKGCLIQAQMDEPFFDSIPPCFDLHDPDQPNHKKSKIGKPCPHFNNCEYHHVYQDLPDTQVYVTTLQSMAYANLPSTVSHKKMLMLEYVLRRSHLIMVDEADRMQFLSDQIFIPSEDLQVWIKEMQQNLEDTLDQKPYQSWKTADSSRWIYHLHQAQGTYHNIRVMLQSDETFQNIQSLIGKQAFTGSKLFGMVSMFMTGVAFEGSTWKGNKKEQESDTESIKKLDAIWESFYDFYSDYRTEVEWEEDSPITRHPLFFIAENADEKDQRMQIRRYLDEQILRYHLTVPDRQKAEDWLRFALLIAHFEKRVYYLSHHFSFVKDDLNLDEDHAKIFQGVSTEYDSLVPISPTGLQFGFRYEYNRGNNGGKLELFRYLGIGRYLLNSLSELFHHLDQKKGAHTILLSGTSFSPHSVKYDLHVPVRYVMRDKKDRRIRIKYIAHPLPITISGTFGEERFRKLEKLTEYIVSIKLIDEALQSFPEGRKRIMLVVGSYEEAQCVTKVLLRMRYDLEDQIFALNPEIEKDEHPEDWQFQRQRLSQFAEGKGKILVAPLMAVERGHNILTILDDEIIAAFGGLMYLVRPYPVPNELAGMASRINHWALHAFKDIGRSKETLYEEFNALRRIAFGIQTDYFRYNLGYKQLKDQERKHLLMDMNTVCWQLEGRLIRGYVDATVYFLDGSFFPMRSKAGNDDSSTSMVLGWQSMFEEISQELDPIQAKIFHLLYEPRIEGLKQLEVL